MKRILFLLLLGTSVFAQNHIDQAFEQDFSKKNYAPEAIEMRQMAMDRNQNVRVLTNQGVMLPTHSEFLFPGSFSPDTRYRTSAPKKIQYLSTVEDQLIFADETHLFSQAWAGRLFLPLPIKDIKALASATKEDHLISDGQTLIHISSASKKTIPSTGKILQILHRDKQYYVLKENSLEKWDGKTLQKIQSGKGFRCLEIHKGQVIIGTPEGLLINQVAKNDLPSIDITSLRSIGEKLWVGTTEGAYSIDSKGKINYYYGERWIPSQEVIQIEPGPEESVLILTKKGLANICFKKMTLKEKAEFFQKQVRSRHIRNGFNATLYGIKNGDLSTGYLGDSDNDGLWTSMYLGAEAFRYAVTQEKDAFENVMESLEAMERLYTVHHLPGFPARSFERSGFKNILADPERWQSSPDPEWDWKATTSSDEAIGHMFVYGVIAELIPELRKRATVLMDTLMSHIVKNDWYLIDHDGKPTQWGRWNPKYVNGFPTNVGDRKLNSSNIISMLQTAYKFTGKEIYKEKALHLLYKEGYLENLMRPMKEIGATPDGGDAYAQMLSEAWNHSDDEMYFLGYWGLYRYALNEDLKQKFKVSIIDHWEAERPEKDGLWNLMTAITGVKDFDLEEAIWYLQEHPLDLIQWEIKNSHRQDIRKMAPNFRKQSLQEVLPPDERPVQRHNANMFNLDKANGNYELSAGDIWLLPYWLGRYLGVISD
jgi:hypothetical protein